MSAARRAAATLAAACAIGCTAVRESGAGAPARAAFEAELSVPGDAAEAAVAPAVDAPAAATKPAKPARVAADCASGGSAVAIGATPVVLRGATSPGATALWLRLSCSGIAEGAELEVAVDGGEIGVVTVADTLHSEAFEWIRAAALEPRDTPVAQTITLRRRNGGALLVDQWAVLGAVDRPDPSWSPPVWRADDGSLELRAAWDASVFDPPWVLHLLREQRDAVARRFGAPLARPLLLIALPAARWPDPQAGAFQSGFAIVLRDDELHLPWRSYAHEIAHVYETELAHDHGLSLPWFLSEGIGCALALEMEEQILGRDGPVAAKERALARLLEEGDAWHRAGEGGGNELLWRGPRAKLDGGTQPGTDERAAAYAWATAVVRAASLRGGEGFWRRLHDELLTEAAGGSGARVLGSAAALALLERAAGQPLDDLYARAGLVEPPD